MKEQPSSRSDEVNEIADWWAAHPYEGRKTVRYDAHVLAKEVVRLRAAVSERGTITAVLKRVLQDCGGAGLIMLNAPCVFCGYKGAGYWQRGTHAKDCPFHDVGGEIERADHIQPRQFERD